jgi:hypothetical protein
VIDGMIEKVVVQNSWDHRRMQSSAEQILGSRTEMSTKKYTLVLRAIRGDSSISGESIL